MRQKSIKSYLMTSFTIGIAISLLAIFTITFELVKKNMTEVKNDSVQLLVEQSSDNLLNHINGMYNSADAIAADYQVYDQAIPYEDKKDKLVEYAETLGISSIGYIDATGYLISTDGFENDVHERQYYQDFLKNINYISDPSFNTSTQKQIIFIGVPLRQNGSIYGGITCTFDSSYLSDIVNNIKYRGEGTAYMINRDGIVVASDDIDKVIDKYNVIEAAASDPSLAKEAEITQKMLDTLNGTLEFNGEKYFYHQVNEATGWILIFKLPTKSFAKEISSLIVVFLIFGFVSLAVVVIISMYIGTKLGNRLIKLKNGLSVIAEGDFSQQLDSYELQKKDEIGQIYRSVDKTVAAIKSTIENVVNVANRLNQQSESFGVTTSNLSQGTTMVKDALSELQSGNSSQANEINNIYSEMEKFNINVEAVNNNIVKVADITGNASDMIQVGDRNINALSKDFAVFKDNFVQFQGSIRSMNESLANISIINSTIGEIASKTNLLSLNASIEAARAGEAGRGFSVVAQEIGTLADQCASSAEEINTVVNAIIGNSEKIIGATDEMDEQIQSQLDAITETLDSFNTLSDQMNEIVPRIKEISLLSEENFEASKVIGNSLSNATALSEALAATTNEVDVTSERFVESSDVVNIASREVLELSQELTDRTAHFRI